MHQFCEAGIALYNPDKPNRPVNSPKAVYQIEPAALDLLRTFGTPAWHDSLTAYLAERGTLVARYAKEREQNRIPVEIAPGKKITLSPGEHSELIRAIIETFARLAIGHFSSLSIDLAYAKSDSQPASALDPHAELRRFHSCRRGA